MISKNPITKITPNIESGLSSGYINFEKLVSIMNSTLKYKLKNGKIYSRIDGKWKELDNHYTKKGY